MPTISLYQDLLARFESADIYSPDLPHETAETTLNALWQTAAGKPCSAQRTPAMEDHIQDLSSKQELFLQTLVSQRLNGTPLPHLTGRVHFMGLELLYEPGVLAPRPETALLGYSASELIARLPVQNVPVLGVDVGCGCGNISGGIATRHPDLRLFSIDITGPCVEMTRKNVAFLNLGERVTVYKGDLFAPLKETGIEGQADIIVSNPPYIPSSKLQSSHSHLLYHEPKEAFDGGIYGFSVHQRLIKESIAMLKPGGYLLFEFGLGQEKQVSVLLSRTKGYSPVVFRKDDAGNPRVAVVQKLAVMQE
jgi:release factor glutamine methyltransferase